MNFNENEHLDKVLKSHNIELEADKMKAYRAVSDAVRKALQKHYRAGMYDPIYSGSYAKRTAINTKFDVDLMVPFSKSHFGTLAAMYDDVFDFLKNKFVPETSFQVNSVSRQRRSLNLQLEVDGYSLDMDVVPAREYKENMFPNDHDLNLYDERENTSILTNVHKHIEYIKGKKDENTEKRREVIRLLKVWKFHHFSSAKSFLLELLAIQAYLDNPQFYQQKLWLRTQGVMQYMVDKVEGIRLKDPANSNNIVTETLSTAEKTHLREALERALVNIRNKPADLEGIFPINLKHKAATLPGARQRPGASGTTSFA